MKKLFFSVVIPTYNRAEDLRFALYCILRQSFRDFEIVISDNSSTDNTKEIVSSMKDRRIRYFRNKRNIGFIPNIRKMIKYAKGDYIFLHGDDDFLFYADALQEICEKIKKYHPGYIRVKYICRTPDKKRIFDFKIVKYFTRNEYLPSLLTNKKVLSFIMDTDPYFLTGIIFKNVLGDNIKIVNCEPICWVEILLYATKNFGGYFIAKPYIVGSWSEWNKMNGYHPVYGIKDGKLASENFFKVVRKQLKKDEYSPFLHNQLLGIYVRLFPIIKFSIGKKNFLRLANKIRRVDPTMAKDITYWIYLFFAFIFPSVGIAIIRSIYFDLYTRFSNFANNKQVVHRIESLTKEYSKSIN